jgi:glucose-1-phosphate thymidylyltransferase
MQKFFEISSTKKGAKRIMKGIILSGGTGSRLWPSTISISKQLLPIFDKPMIYYPLTTLMTAGIRDILIIVTPRDVEAFKSLLGDGTNFGLNLVFEVQAEPRGLAEAFIIGEQFIGNDAVALILGDNLFHGEAFGSELESINDISGARIFASHVKDPQRYGVISFDSQGRALSIEEKPKKPNSNYAIPGLYFFDNKVVKFAKNVEFSSRQELEITSVLNEYLLEKNLQVKVLPKGTAWLDTGTFESLHDASSYVRVLEERQGYKMGCPEEEAFLRGWIDEIKLKQIITKYGNSPYATYLESLLPIP